MPDPEKGAFQVLTPKGAGVTVGEEFEFRLSPDAELRLRVQCLERVLSRIPMVGQDYSRELQRVGLKKLDRKLP